MPAKSKAQQQAAGIALAVKKGKLPKSKLRGSSKSMYKSMSKEDLSHYAETSHKALKRKLGRKDRG